MHFVQVSMMMICFEVCVQLFIAAIPRTRASALQIGCERIVTICATIVMFHNFGNAQRIRCEQVIAWVTNCVVFECQREVVQSVNEHRYAWQL